MTIQADKDKNQADYDDNSDLINNVLAKSLNAREKQPLHRFMN